MVKADQAKNRAGDFGGFYGEEYCCDDDDWHDDDWGECEVNWGGEGWSSNGGNSSSWGSRGDQRDDHSPGACAYKGSKGSKGRGI
eukprot:1235746-Pyramimonas_sp.AAC.1